MKKYEKMSRREAHGAVRSSRKTDQPTVWVLLVHLKGLVASSYSFPFHPHPYFVPMDVNAHAFNGAILSASVLITSQSAFFSMLLQALKHRCLYMYEYQEHAGPFRALGAQGELPWQGNGVSTVRDPGGQGCQFPLWHTICYLDSF